MNGGTRASGTPGYDASAAYVGEPPEEGRLQGHRAGVRLPVLEELAPAQLTQVSPTPTDYETATLRLLRQRRRDRDGRADRRHRDPADPRRRARRAGCEAADFARARHRTAGRAHPARHLRLRGQGRERAGRRLRRRDHLQRGPARPHGPVRRHAGRSRPSRSRSSGSASPTAQALYSDTQAGPVVGPRRHLDRARETRQTTNVIADSKKGDARQGAGRRRAPGLRARGPGHQRQRQRHVDDPRDRRADVRG